VDQFTGSGQEHARSLGTGGASVTDRFGLQGRDALRAQQWIAECETLISRRGHRIAFRRRGQGPTVLMLHGFPTWSYDYAEVADDLARDHDVIRLDFLGYGASDKPNPYEYSVAESADVVEGQWRPGHVNPEVKRSMLHRKGQICMPLY
jgi:hypothetical protein